MFQPVFVLAAWYDGRHSAICVRLVRRTKAAAKSHEAAGWVLPKTPRIHRTFCIVKRSETSSC